MPRRLLTLTAAAVVLAGCASTTDDPGLAPEPPPVAEQPPAPVPMPPEEAPRVPEEEMQPTLVELVPDAVDVRQQDWTEVFVLDGGTTLELRWWGGVAPCDVPTSVEVDPGDDVVRVSLFVGSAPTEDGEQRACIAVAQYTAVRVTLDEPVGQRSIVDTAD